MGVRRRQFCLEADVPRGVYTKESFDGDGNLRNDVKEGINLVSRGVTLNMKVGKETCPPRNSTVREWGRGV